MALGMEMMLKQMGLDVPQMMQQFQQLLKFAESVDSRLTDLQTKLANLQRKIDALEVVEENEN